MRIKEELQDMISRGYTDEQIAQITGWKVEDIKNERVNKIRRAREAIGITRIELSKRSGVPLRTLENWELGVRKPTDVYQLMKVAEALEVKIEDIV